jgi:hypothetical protein
MSCAGRSNSCRLLTCCLGTVPVSVFAAPGPRVLVWPPAPTPGFSPTHASHIVRPRRSLRPRTRLSPAACRSAASVDAAATSVPPPPPRVSAVPSIAMVLLLLRPPAARAVSGAVVRLIGSGVRSGGRFTGSSARHAAHTYSPSCVHHHPGPRAAVSVSSLSSEGYMQVRAADQGASGGLGRARRVHSQRQGDLGQGQQRQLVRPGGRRGWAQRDWHRREALVHKEVTAVLVRMEGAVLQVLDKQGRLTQGCGRAASATPGATGQRAHARWKNSRTATAVPLELMNVVTSKMSSTEVRSPVGIRRWAGYPASRRSINPNTSRWTSLPV